MAFSCLLKIALRDGAGLAGLWVLPWHGGQSWRWCGAVCLGGRCRCAQQSSAPCPSWVVCVSSCPKQSLSLSRPCDGPWLPACSGGCPFTAGGDPGAGLTPWGGAHLGWGGFGRGAAAGHQGPGTSMEWEEHPWLSLSPCARLPQHTPHVLVP